MPLLTPPEPTLFSTHRVLFSITDWNDLVKPRRRRCPRCRGYLWLDLDRAGYEHLVCSVCGWEE